MATITISDLPNDVNAKVVIQINPNFIIEMYIPKQIADLITNVNSANITIRQNADRVINGA